MTKESQLQLQEKISEELSIHICTCGSCGNIVLIDEKVENLENITCPWCGYEEEFCGFPDLIF
jgi:DNA-directed RNA polymerase subunit M/transcription elongation factor TFIIS